MNYCILNIILILSLNDVLGSLSTTNETNTIDGTNNTDIEVTYTIPTTPRLSKNTAHLAVGRERNIMLYGLKKTEYNGRELRTIVYNIIKYNVSVDDFEPEDLKFVQRLGTQLYAPVLVKLRNIHMVKNVLSRKSRLNGTNIRLDIDLKPETLRRNNILKPLRTKLKDMMGVGCRVQYGKLFVDGKRISKEQVDKLLFKAKLLTTLIESSRTYTTSQINDLSFQSNKDDVSSSEDLTNEDF